MNDTLTKPMTHYLPAKPLVEAFQEYCHRHALSHKQAAIELGLERSTYYNWQQRDRVTWKTADRVAVAMGMHPGSIWPLEWFS